VRTEPDSLLDDLTPKQLATVLLVRLARELTNGDNAQAAALLMTAGVEVAKKIGVRPEIVRVALDKMLTEATEETP
jgi:hypothetical protein